MFDVNLEIETTRFGTVSVDGDRVLGPSGLALPATRWVCCSPMKRDASTGSNRVIRKIWLLSSRTLSTGFPTLKRSSGVNNWKSLAANQIEDAQVFVIVNGHQSTLTANLQGPLVVGTASRRGMQLVLAETRHVIVELKESCAGPANCCLIVGGPPATIFHLSTRTRKEPNARTV